MNVWKNLIWLIIFSLLSSCACSFANKKNFFEQASSFNEVVNYAKNNLQPEGILKQNPDGYGFLKLEDEYIHSLFPLLKDIPGFKKPPYFRRPDAPGAHISVVYEGEKVKLEEVGQKFSFKLRDVKIIQAGKDVSYILLEVDAPSLEKLREKYGLQKMLNGHEFHITIAKKINK